MLLVSLLFSLSAHAAQSSTYTYQTTVTNSSLSCQEEAQKLALRFEKATGVKPTQALCRSEQDLKTHKIYALGLSYKSTAAFTPYIAEIGKRAGTDFSSSGHEKLYPTLNNCLSDLNEQARLFETYTGLTAVAVTCKVTANYELPSQISLSIEGFSKANQARPKEYLYHFGPKVLENSSGARQNQIVEFLTSVKAHVAKDAAGIVAYYRAENPAPMTIQDVAWLTNEAECAIQQELATELFAKAGFARPSSWCEQDRLVVLFEGRTQLVEFRPYTSAGYVTLQDCLNDREFVLSDSRNSHAVGALCTRDISDLPYAMKLFRKAW